MISSSLQGVGEYWQRLAANRCVTVFGQSGGGASDNAADPADARTHRAMIMRKLEGLPNDSMAAAGTACRH